RGGFVDADLVEGAVELLLGRVVGAEVDRAGRDVDGLGRVGDGEAALLRAVDQHATDRRRAVIGADDVGPYPRRRGGGRIAGAGAARPPRAADAEVELDAVAAAGVAQQVLVRSAVT